MRKIYVSFLWHFHQPYYKESIDGNFSMAWVRLHSVKDYIGMANHLLEFPKMKATFNFTPSLIAQIVDYVEGKAEDKIQKICKKNVSDLTYSEKCYLLDKLFQTNWNNLIRIWHRYEELYRKRRVNIKKAEEIVGIFSDQDLLDLEVWFNLSWIHQTEIEKDNFLQELQKKGRDFSKSELDILLKKHIEIMSKIMPMYKKLKENSQAELITSPYYHPILPLLFNMESALIAMPNKTLPKRSEELREDGIIQIKKGIELFEGQFGFSPRGIWPSEGSVSPEIIPTFTECGINWIATDEEILGNSLNRNIKNLKERPELLYRPYKLKVSNKEINIIFRDHFLSDLIGFKYQSWDSQAAADDIVNKLIEISKHTCENSIVNIILDGENAWEYYPNNGVIFLRDLYKKISENDFIIPITVSEYLEKFPPDKQINTLYSGSWIEHNFYIWVGHYEDVKAWEYLYKTRDELKRFIQKENIENKKLNKAWEELYIAEGSDWFWWFGDDHNSGEDDMYDFLFREHLMNVYRYVEKPIPEYLKIPIIAPEKEAIYSPPVELLKVKIDGLVSDFFEWSGAGIYNSKSEKIAMDFDIEKLIKEIYFGFDLKNFFLRIDTFKNPLEIFQKNRKILIQFISPKNIKIELSNNTQGKIEAHINGNKIETFSIKKIIEFAISFDTLGFSEREVVQFYFEIFENSSLLERIPLGGLITYEVPDKEFELKYWNV